MADEQQKENAPPLQADEPSARDLKEERLKKIKAEEEARKEEQKIGKLAVPKEKLGRISKLGRYR